MWRDRVRSAGPRLLPLAVLLVDLAVIAWWLPGEPVRDEAVFLPAARVLADAGWLPSLAALDSYPAPQTPLGLYLAGRVLSLWPSLGVLRVLNALLIAAALACFGRFASRIAPRHAWLACALLALNPYLHLVATHFYTDAAYFFVLVLVVTRAPGMRFWLLLVPLFRQLGVYFALGEAAHSLTQRRYRDALLALLALLPVVALFAVWRGAFPNGARSETFRAVHAAFGWVFPYVSAYHLSALGFYAAPFVLLIPRSRTFWIGVALAAALASLAPAHQNFSSQLADPGNLTLGLVHRVSLLLGARGSYCLLAALAGLGGGLAAVTCSVPAAWRYFVVLFLVLSAFGFQAWDKYVLEALPALLLALLSVSAQPLQRAH